EFLLLSSVYCPKLDLLQLPLLLQASVLQVAGQGAGHRANQASDQEVGLGANQAAGQRADQGQDLALAVANQVAGQQVDRLCLRLLWGCPRQHWQPFLLLSSVSWPKLDVLQLPLLLQASVLQVAGQGAGHRANQASDQEVVFGANQAAGQRADQGQVLALAVANQVAGQQVDRLCLRLLWGRPRQHWQPFLLLRCSVSCPKLDLLQLPLLLQALVLQVVDQGADHRANQASDHEVVFGENQAAGQQVDQGQAWVLAAANQVRGQQVDRQHRQAVLLLSSLYCPKLDLLQLPLLLQASVLQEAGQGAGHRANQASDQEVVFGANQAAGQQADQGQALALAVANQVAGQQVDCLCLRLLWGCPRQHWQPFLLLSSVSWPKLDGLQLPLLLQASVLRVAGQGAGHRANQASDQEVGLGANQAAGQNQVAGQQVDRLCLRLLWGRPRQHQQTFLLLPSSVSCPKLDLLQLPLLLQALVLQVVDQGADHRANQASDHEVVFGANQAAGQQEFLLLSSVYCPKLDVLQLPLLLQASVLQVVGQGAGHRANQALDQEVGLGANQAEGQQAEQGQALALAVANQVAGQQVDRLCLRLLWGCPRQHWQPFLLLSSVSWPKLDVLQLPLLLQASVLQVAGQGAGHRANQASDQEVVFGANQAAGQRADQGQVLALAVANQVAGQVDRLCLRLLWGCPQQHWQPFLLLSSVSWPKLDVLQFPFLLQASVLQVAGQGAGHRANQALDQEVGLGANQAEGQRADQGQALALVANQVAGQQGDRLCLRLLWGRPRQHRQAFVLLSLVSWPKLDVLQLPLLL
ncbi:unnamed protein product, partial [Effrenium voratum]